MREPMVIKTECCAEFSTEIFCKHLPDGGLELSISNGYECISIDLDYAQAKKLRTYLGEFVAK
jgi:hypothetical protein